MMLIIYSTHINNRLKYICDFFWGERHLLTSDKESFVTSDLAKINYSTEKIANSFQILPEGLLSESDIQKNRTIQYWNDTDLLQITPINASLIFDVFAASFFLLTRYEEYFPSELDKFGRYAHTASTAFRSHLLHLPIIDIWQERVEFFLQKSFPQFEPSRSDYSYQATVDVDVAFKYLHKPWSRQFARSLVNIKNGEWAELKERINVRTGKIKDPYNIYSELRENIKPFNPVFFIPIAEKIVENDRNISPNNKGFQTFIRSLATDTQIGLHPSWQSYRDIHILKEEKRKLESIIQTPITASRQHYIRMQLPETYERLIAIGITEDYSMGYPTINGFRASTARTFAWYNLKKEESTTLKLFPFAWMDANSHYQLQQTPENALLELAELSAVVKQYGGNCISVHHNEFFTQIPEFVAWKELIYRYWKK